MLTLHDSVIIRFWLMALTSITALNSINSIHAKVELYLCSFPILLTLYLIVVFSYNDILY